MREHFRFSNLKMLALALLALSKVVTKCILFGRRILRKCTDSCCHILSMLLINVSGFQAKRVVLYLGRAQPVKTLDEMMFELQTVESLACTIERTETPPFYR